MAALALCTGLLAPQQDGLWTGLLAPKTASGRVSWRPRRPLDGPPGAQAATTCVPDCACRPRAKRTFDACAFLWVFRASLTTVLTNVLTNVLTDGRQTNFAACQLSCMSTFSVGLYRRVTLVFKLGFKVLREIHSSPWEAKKGHQHDFNMDSRNGPRRPPAGQKWCSKAVLDLRSTSMSDLDDF